jgi:hypothetical protein
MWLAEPRAPELGFGPMKCAIPLLLLLVLTACGEAPPPPPTTPAVLPAGPEARDLHCYLVLTLAIDQLAEFDRAGRRGGFVAGSGAEELLRARSRITARLDADLLESLREDPWPRLEATLAKFDADGDGQLATAREVEDFNQHVAACVRS